MDKATLKAIKEKLLTEKTKILNSGVLSTAEDLHIQPEDLPDEADLAATVINQQVTFTIRQREMTKLRRIEDALQRAEESGFGVCEDCDEPIGKKRIMNQPWATLCITHAEELEREQGYAARLG